MRRGFLWADHGGLSESAEDILSERDAGVLPLKPDVLILKPDILRKSIV